MRLDSPFVLAISGALAIHVLVATAVDAVVVNFPYRPKPPAPRIELVDIEVPKPPEPPKPPPPPVVKPEVKPEPPPNPAPRPQKTVKQQIQEPPPTAEPPPTETPPQEDTPGGDEVVTLDEAPPGATGVAVKVGKRNTGKHIGRGGTGGGTGAGSGSGTAEETPPPVSVATIKTRAMPKGDYGYFADYPQEAKQLGIEGDIRVRLIVDDKGKVKQAVLLNRLGHGLDELALSRAKQIEFDPAKDTEDKPVTSVVVWTFHMTLPK
jgi:protein TonB